MTGMGLVGKERLEEGRGGRKGEVGAGDLGTTKKKLSAVISSSFRNSTTVRRGT
jgi:hypothetical protein